MLPCKFLAMLEKTVGLRCEFSIRNEKELPWANRFQRSGVGIISASVQNFNPFSLIFLILARINSFSTFRTHSSNGES